MFGIRLIVVLAVMGGVIAYIADKLGSKIGKKRMSVFGLRPHKTSVLLTVLSGVLIAACSVGVLAVSSQSARTALFGMDKLQRELAGLASQQQQAQGELDQALAQIEAKNSTIVKLDKEIKDAQQAKKAAEQNMNLAQSELHVAQNQYMAARNGLVSAQREVSNLSEAKDRLNLEIQGLNKETEVLKQGLQAMKEGQLLYRSGEIVFAGVLKSGQSSEENEQQIKWLLQSANTAALQRMGLKEDAAAEPVWIVKGEHDRLKAALNESKTDLLVRVLSVSNIVAGQPVVCTLSMYGNKTVYTDGTLLYRKIVNMDEPGISAEYKFVQFLNDVNRLTVQAGVLPDPVSGKVGAIDAAASVEAVKKMQHLGGKIVLSAYADGKIVSAGPVRLKVEVERIADVKS